MNKKMKRLTTAGLCIFMVLLPACSGDGGQQEGNTRAMGRYVESQVPLPEDFYPMVLQKRSDGTLDLFGFDTDEADMMYSSKDGENWDSSKSLEFPGFSDGAAYFNSAAYGQGDELHLLVSGIDQSGGEFEFYSQVYKEKADGTMEEIDIQWAENQGNEVFGIQASNIKIGNSGDFVISQVGAGYVQYGSDGSLKHVYRENTADDYIAVSSTSVSNYFYTISGDLLYIKDDPSNSILSFNMENGELVQELPFDSYTTDMTLASGTEGSVYAINSSGVFKLLAGGSVWEKIVDGNLSSLSLPTIDYKDFIEMDDGTMYMLAQNMDSTNLFKYTYDETIASVPEKEIVVYTLEENVLLRQAAGEYQRLNPETMINIQVAGGSGSAVTSDLVRALNTELLAGKGPDIILLDGMNVESYIEKGALTDISDLVKEVDSKGGGLIPTVKEAYTKDDKVYAIPAKFSLPVMAAEKEITDQLKTLEDVASFASSNQDKGLLGNRDPEVLLNQFLPASAGAWIHNGKIDESNLEAFLISLKEIYSVTAKNYPLSGDQYYTAEDENLYHWAFGRAHIQTMSISSGYSDLTALTATRELKPDAVFSYMPGQVENPYVPSSIVSVNANSTQADEAKGFIRLLLSEDLQVRELFDGFPVNSGALETLIAENESVFIGFMDPYDETMLTGPWPSLEEQRELKELCMNIKTPFNVDGTLLQMITEVAVGYITGEKDLTETMEDIKEATKIYLSE